jgi:uncharacterized protein (TIGR03435 family)
VVHRCALSNAWIKLLLAAIAAAGLVWSQPQLPPARSGFEVASVKPAADADGRSLLQAVPGRLITTNLALRRLILIAYGMQDYQLVGDPSWLSSEHYDIVAKADGNTSVQQMEGPMLQVLLEERFKLTLHRETRQLPVYKLAVVNGATKLQHSKEGSCTPYSVDSPPPPSIAGEPRPTFCGIHLAADGLNRILEGRGVTMEMLAANLSRNYNSLLGRNVLDATGLTGAFDLHLKWTIDPLTASSGPDTEPPPELAGPSILTALRDQLGLKLESAKGPVEVLVIDHIEKPSAN